MKRLRTTVTTLIPALVTFLFLGCALEREPADLVLLNGKIVTVDSRAPVVEALAVKDARIQMLGTDEEIRECIGPSTEILDLGGRLAIPGFIEGHAHFRGIGEARSKLDLRKARSWDQIVDIVADAVRESTPGQWILGRGWHQEKWDTAPEPNLAGLPIHDSLSRVSPLNPVLLTHASGHATIANAKAMQLAAITPEADSPEGGEIIRDARGRPIGVFRETAQALLHRALERSRVEKTKEQRRAALRRVIALATDECLENGVTSFQDAGASFEFLDCIREMAETGQLRLRLYGMINEPDDQLARHLSDYRVIDAGDHRLTVRAVKRFIDGALGAHGAWLLEPYQDLPTSCGLNTTPVESLTRTAEMAIAQGLQLCVHAIGDRANREVLDLYEKTFQKYPQKKDLRWRVEHAQHLHPDDIPRFAQLGVIASMQPIHATSDGPWVVQRLGEVRSRLGAYVWRRLLDSGARIASGTDAPVEDVNPIQNFYAAVTRRLSNGDDFFPEECMTRQEALRSLTLDCAYAAFEEQTKGSLSAGKLADITVLSQDILTISTDQIPDTEVVYTFVGGEIVYSQEGL